ncbi:hypothetical protein B0T25DRAFT_347921 [Lasiosphaeria hispida]|uniref:Uncharacterized protein n=1 Tax=Lasiosphaeria hispida TaxID=260671 RepID=A0AAJ0H775_9PEZI|nr:hypothetical protein B0T25DRAFT_347921 [Lasiosphaeria hispida]
MVWRLPSLTKARRKQSQDRTRSGSAHLKPKTRPAAPQRNAKHRQAEPLPTKGGQRFLTHSLGTSSLDLLGRGELLLDALFVRPQSPCLVCNSPAVANDQQVLPTGCRFMVVSNQVASSHLGGYFSCLAVPCVPDVSVKAPCWGRKSLWGPPRLDPALPLCPPTTMLDPLPGKETAGDLPAASHRNSAHGRACKPHPSRQFSSARQTRWLLHVVELSRPNRALLGPLRKR